MIPALMLPAQLFEIIHQAAYGGKAAQLSVAARAGLPVPHGVALPAGFVDGVAAGEATVLIELEEVSGRLQFPLAVRSSAVGEDTETASFAGQHLTRLNVGSARAVVETVRAIWNSARSPAALAYRKRLGVEGEPRMGVIVQEMVTADCAGVLFTRNPVNGADEIVIEASWGLGEAVVAGLVTPDRFRLKWDGRVIEQVAGVKDVVVRIVPEGGTMAAELPPDLARTLCLDDSQLHELHGLAARCEEVFGGAQDLEWAFSGKTLYLLQRRPVTRAA